MTPGGYKLLSVLADGQYHSGESLGRALGVSRAAVWKQIQQLEDLSLDITSVKGKGYCLSGGLDLLQAREIKNALNAGPGSKGFAEVVVEPVMASSSQFLLEKSIAGENIHGLVCLAEMQLAGRGRRGRAWRSPFACNLYCSLGWRIENGVNALEGLSLAVGVAVSESLLALGVPGVQLKWPNDLLYEKRKLGGILLEINGDAAGECDLVLGLGLNIKMPASTAGEIDQPWVDLYGIAGEALPNRNDLAAKVIGSLLELLGTYEDLGFSHYKNRWQQLNAYQNKIVCLQSGKHSTQGVMRGVGDSGALMLEVNGAIKEFIGGEISLRPAE